MSGGAARALDAPEKMQDHEKCYGVAKAGKNDCAAKDGSNSAQVMLRKIMMQVRGFMCQKVYAINSPGA